MEAAGSWGSWARSDFWRWSPREGEIGATRSNRPQRLENRQENRGAGRGRRWGSRDTPHPKGRGGAAGGGQRRGRSEGFQEALHPRRDLAGPLHPALALLTWELRGEKRATAGRRGCFQLHSLTWRPTSCHRACSGLPPLGWRRHLCLLAPPLSLCAPLPAGPPATAEHRARAAREEAQRADDHRVRSPDDLSPPQATHSLPASAPGRKRK